MKTTTIRQRLFFLVMVPLLALAVTATGLVFSAYQDYRSVNTTQEVLKVAVDAGELIHTLQIERGATAGFLQSKGAKFADVLPGIRKNTDDKLSDYSVAATSSASLSAAFASAIGKAGEHLDSIKNLRTRADKFELSVADEVAAYTATIASLIEVMTERNNLSAQSNHATADELDALANELRLSVARFKV